MLKDKLHKARRILSTPGVVGIVALAWLIAPVGVGNVVPLTSSAEAQATLSDSKSDPEAIREALRHVLEQQLDAAMMLGSTRAQEAAARALEMLEQLTSEDLALFEEVELKESLSDLAAKQDALDKHLETLEKHVPNLGEILQQSSEDFSSLQPRGLPDKDHAIAKSHIPGLTDAVYGPPCDSNVTGNPPFGPNRSNTAVVNGLLIGIHVSDVGVFLAEEVLLAAEVVKEEFGRICEQVGGLIGFTANASLACIPTDLLFFGAKEIEILVRAAHEALEDVFERFTFCDGDIDGAEIEGVYERAADIFKQNMAHDTALTAHDTALTTHDVNINAALAAHDTNLAAHDININAALATHDANIKAALANADAALAAHDAKLAAFVANDLRLRRVEFVVHELSERDRFLLGATERGIPVDNLTLISLLAARKPKGGPLSFTDILATVTMTKLADGLFEVNTNLDKRDHFLQFHVKHEDGAGVEHFGTALVSRQNDSGTGQ